jgi:hypothetical protein
MSIGIENMEIKTEYYYKEEDILKYYDEIQIPEDFVFFNGKTGVSKKDLPLDYIKMWMKDNNIDLPIVSPDTDWDVAKVPMHFSVDVMKKAKYRFFSDSALYHACHAIDLPVDLVYYQRGKRVWNIVHPLHTNNETVIYNI